MVMQQSIVAVNMLHRVLLRLNVIMHGRRRSAEGCIPDLVRGFAVCW